MFSLIITIISIALIAAVAVASVYYGGDAFTQGNAKALAATVVGQGQQISAANTLFKNDNGGVTAANVAALVSGLYLQAAPTMPSTVGAVNLDLAADGSVQAVIDNSSVCDKINAQLGLTTQVVPDAAGMLGLNQQYGCAIVGADAATGAKTFFYKG